MLFSPENHEPLSDERWDEERVRVGIRQIVVDAEAALEAAGLWPADEWDARGARLPLAQLYGGAAGVAWALDVLRRRGHADVGLNLGAAMRRALEKWRAEPDAPERREPPVTSHAGLFFGESGILLVAFRVAPSSELANDLHARVRENWDCETNRDERAHDRLAGHHARCEGNARLDG